MRRAKPKLELGTEQARRVIYMYNKFLDGNSYSSAEMYDEISKVFKVNLSLRTVQRDLRTLHDMADGMEQINVGRQVYWRLSKGVLNPAYLNEIDSSDIFKFHYLKTLVKQYVKTPIGKEADKFLKRLESHAPGEAFMEESKDWINEWGKVDYRNYSNVFEEIVTAIINKQWVNITYNEFGSDVVQHQFAMFKGFFTYHGSILFAAYVPRKYGYLALPLESITKSSIAKPYNEYVPEFDPKVFFEERFGIQKGEIVNLNLKFEGEYATFFGNRIWNSKQVVSYDSEGAIGIRFNVAFNQELVSWLLSMDNYMTVLGPQMVIDAMKEKSRNIIEKYK
ncbi:MAG: hypothetical protein A2X64_04210 [Ignavibacteria bacterium GWF2_33_9]|nr:MAG: hypothetical protein A2X64_04210 [Ignavibacteria bacterium GWF2_33_9]